MRKAPTHCIAACRYGEVKCLVMLGCSSGSGNSDAMIDRRINGCEVPQDLK